MKCLKNLSYAEKKLTQKLLDNIAKDLDNYNVIMKSLDVGVTGDFNFKINYAIERSVAHYCSNVIEDIMKSHFTDVILLNEAGLNLISLLSSTESKSILDLVENDIKGTLTKRKIMYPDNLMKFSLNNLKAYVFIEYKVNDAFKYFDLANDLIKYLIYTKNSSEKSYFMYVVFNPDDYITIKPTGRVIYQILQNKISKSTINFDANIFLYDVCSEDRENSIEDQLENDDLVIKLKSISKIIDIMIRIEKLGLSDTDVLESEDYDSNPFYKKKDGFGQNVITAKVIKNNYNILGVKCGNYR